MALSDRQIKNAKPTGKKQTLSDGRGLALVITPAGGKSWQYNFRFQDKQKTLHLGLYPDISLQQARSLHQEARTMLANGIDPAAAAKQEAKQQQREEQANTFATLARQWHAANLHRWKENHAARVWLYLQNDVFPLIGKRPIAEISVREVKAVLDGIIVRGAFETASKVRQWIGAVFDYAAMLEITTSNPARVLRSFMPKSVTQHMPALPQEELTEFYQRLMLADAKPENKIGLKLIMLTFVRNTELRGAQWAEIDWPAKTWNIPAHRMKRPRAHAVPLSDWALELLEALRSISGSHKYLFPSRTAHNGYISENTLGKIMHGMGYKDLATPHGFRSLASSVLNEQGYNPDAIERQLAHVEENKIKSAYNRADYWQERQAMMQWYSDFLRQHYEAAQGQSSS